MVSRWALTLVCLVFACSGRVLPAQNPQAVRLGQLITLAEQQQQKGQHRQAIATFAQARGLARQLFGARHLNVAALAQSEGLLHRQLGDYEQAQTLVTEALAISEEVNDVEMAAESANNLAAIRWELGNYLASLEMHERAFHQFRRLYGEDSPTLAVSRNNLAGVYKSLGQTAEAEPLFQRSIQILERHRPKYDIQLADAMMNLADLYSSQGDLTRAELLLLRSIEIKQSAVGKDHFEVARTTNNLATLDFPMGQFDKSETKHRETLALLEKSLGADSLDVARSLVNLANLYQRREKYTEAEPLYLRALENRRKRLAADHPDVATTLHNLGGLYIDSGQFDRAEDLLGQALEARKARFGGDHPMVAYTLMSKGFLRQRQQKYEEAEQLYREALAIREARLPENHPDRAYSQHALGELAGIRGDWSMAVGFFDQARRGFRRYGAQVLPALAEPDQLAFIKEVDEGKYHAALSLVLKQPNDSQIVAATASWAVNGKALAQQTLAQRALLTRDTSNPLVSTIAKMLLSVRKQLASLALVAPEDGEEVARRKRLDELAEQEQQLSREVAQKGGSATVGQSWVELKTVRQALPDDAVLVDLVRFEAFDFAGTPVPGQKYPEHYVAWVIRPGDTPLQAIDLGDAAEIDQLVSAARAELHSAPAVLLEHGEPDAEEKLLPSLTRLSEKILQPLIDAVADNKQVILSPDSVLWLVPWNALVLKDGRYAIENYDIRFVTSGRDVVRGPGDFKPSKPVLFADPNYDLSPAAAQQAMQRIFKSQAPRAGLVRATAAGSFKLGAVSRLPGTKAEAAAIQPKLEAYAGQSAYVYTDQWALEGVFKQISQPRVLVLSTHGFFATPRENKAGPAAAGNNPLLRCGLLLAGCNHPLDTSQVEGDDGILTGLEILGTDLRGTELVVLSACETGLGEVRHGEGVAGLRQAFQLAGARSVVATLWQIPDRETARLMTDFFTRLAETGDQASSLREAQLKLISSRRARFGAAHPFYWAAFTLTGS